MPSELRNSSFGSRIKVRYCLTGKSFEIRHYSYNLPFVPHTNRDIANMETNEILREQIFEIIKNQLRDNDPPETKITYDRLIKNGFDDFQTRQMIGQCLAVELFDVMKFGKPYNNERYIKNLLALPKEPFD